MQCAYLALLFLLLLQHPSAAYSLSEVETLLAETVVPDGVVFEIIDVAPIGPAQIRTDEALG